MLHDTAHNLCIIKKREKKKKGESSCDELLLALSRFFEPMCNPSPLSLEGPRTVFHNFPSFLFFYFEEQNDNDTLKSNKYKITAHSIHDNNKKKNNI